MPQGSGTAVAQGSSRGGLVNEINEAIEQMEKLKVSGLKLLLKSMQLAISGLKAQQQGRIRDFIRRSMSSEGIDPTRPKATRVLISMIHDGKDPLPSYFSVWEAIRQGRSIPSGGSLTHQSRQAHQTAARQSSAQAAATRQQQQQQRQQYEVQLNSVPNTLPGGGGRSGVPPLLPVTSSIFYNVLKRIPTAKGMLPRNENRGKQQLRFLIDDDGFQLLKDDETCRVFLFCYEVKYAQDYAIRPIEFPFLNEIMINGHKVTDNVRGIKNKPGTAKPADLTKFLKKSPSVLNVLDIIYAQTTKPYLAECFYVKTVPAMKLVENILQRPKVTKATTLRFIKKLLDEESDEDFVTTSMVMSLQCPISYTRMKYPAKSKKCNHIQCFDAQWYLLSQEQVPTWLCPVCSKCLNYEDLEISEYVAEIISQCDEEVEQVEINRDGTWKAISEDDDENANAKQPKSPVKQESVGNGMLPQTGENHENHHQDAVVISLDSDSEEEELPTVADVQEPAPVEPPVPIQTTASPAVPVTAPMQGPVLAQWNVNRQASSTTPVSVPPATNLLPSLASATAGNSQTNSENGVESSVDSDKPLSELSHIHGGNGVAPARPAAPSNVPQPADSVHSNREPLVGDEVRNLINSHKERHQGNHVSQRSVQSAATAQPRKATTGQTIINQSMKRHSSTGGVGPNKRPSLDDVRHNSVSGTSISTLPGAITSSSSMLGLSGPSHIVTPATPLGAHGATTQSSRTAPTTPAAPSATLASAAAAADSGANIENLTRTMVSSHNNRNGIRREISFNSPSLPSVVVGDEGNSNISSSPTAETATSDIPSNLTGTTSTATTAGPPLPVPSTVPTLGGSSSLLGLTGSPAVIGKSMDPAATVSTHPQSTPATTGTATTAPKPVANGRRVQPPKVSPFIPRKFQHTRPTGASHPHPKPAAKPAVPPPVVAPVPVPAPAVSPIPNASAFEIIDLTSDEDD